jgi:hypothetical protein
VLHSWINDALKNAEGKKLINDKSKWNQLPLYQYIRTLPLGNQAAPYFHFSFYSPPQYIVTVASIPQLLLLLFGALHHPSLVKYLFTLCVPNKTLTTDIKCSALQTQIDLLLWTVTNRSSTWHWHDCHWH